MSRSSISEPNAGEPGVDNLLSHARKGDEQELGKLLTLYRNYLTILATTQLGVAILAESTLSFLGYGVPPPFPTWGSMLSGTGRAYMLQSPWLGIWPGLAISGAVFGFNMLGDALRDLLDPRLKGG